MEKLIRALQEKQYTIASIESLTAGLFASKLAEVSNASAVLKGTLVTYQTCVKEDVLHVDKQLIATYGVISKQCVEVMAKQGQALFQSDICVSFSGNAGPSAIEDKPVGLVHMSLCMKERQYCYEEIFTGSRNEIRAKACEFMKKQILIQISKEKE